jgi:SAM-dependent methyltransferase
MVDLIAYLADVAESNPGRDYKQHTLTALDLRPGQTVLDIGCGPGTDLGALATEVGATGRVIGVDVDPVMVEEARRRHASRPEIEIRLGDALGLPVDEHSVDRARADRMVQHVAEPAAVFAELRRVLRPGGIACVAEPDWDTLAVDPGELETNRAFNRFVCDTIVRNATIGRQLPRLAEQAGLTVRSVSAESPLFRDLEPADKILGLRRNAGRAVAAGYLDRAAADAWIAALTGGPFLATCLLVIAVLEAPR